MKPQQRKFIVEVKSPRRRSMIRPTSIWGDTDLKALVREAETEAPHLFEPVEGRSEFSPAQSVELRPNDSASTVHTPPPADPPVLMEVVADVDEALDDAAIALSDADKPKTSSGKRPNRRRRTRSIHRGDRRTPIAATEVETAPDDLAALEEEYRWLKGLLLHRLHQENIQLRRMLERFGTN